MNDKTDSYDVTAEADQAHDDQWLADAVVALGVGVSGNNDWYLPPDHEFGATSVSAQVFLRDWRVAGALMEKCREDAISINIDGIHTQGYVEVFNLTDRKFPVANIDESLSRAIIEACVEALS